MDDSFDLTRRKALAALGTIGVASAGAGLGTSAYFSDQETFENNQLTAGTLDMKVAATEYYSDWSPDEAEYAGMASDDASTDIRLPPGAGQSDARAIALDLDDDYDGDASDVYAAFFETISTDADGNPYNRVNGGVSAAAEGLCGTDSDADGPVIIDIGDVKPGDFGGARFAFELCDNPGYVWLTGGLRDASENGTTEPEADDPDEEDGVVELLDEIQVAYGVGPIDGDTAAFEDTDAGFQPTTQRSLREFLAALNGEGVALDGDIDAEIGGGTGEQGCFSGGNPDESSVHEVSVVWWLPIDHGNQVQSDSVTFDLGFYTEQCRHNDGETDLVAYYPFEGSADDVSGNGYDGSNAGDVSYASGRVGQAASFDGDGDYVSVADDAGLDLTSRFSLSAWVKTPQPQPSYTRLISRERSGQGNRQYNLGVTPGGSRPRTVVDTEDTNGVEVSGTTEVTDGSWHHIAVTFAADDGLRLYVDGTLEDQTPVSAPVVSRPSDLVLSGVAHSPTQLQFSGLADDVRIYSRALSAGEVQSLYESG
jgi:predicted ribosomally synthesized peptide with SipW-like signal peptide